MVADDDRIEQRLRQLFSAHRTETPNSAVRPEVASTTPRATNAMHPEGAAQAGQQALPTLTLTEYEHGAEDRDSQSVAVVHFLLGNSHYAVPLAEVREVQILPTLTRVPNADATVVGLINLRGNVVSVIDVRSRLSIEHAPSPRTARVLVFEAAGGLVGVLVDAVLGPARLPLPLLDPPAGGSSELLRGVVELDGVPITMLRTAKLIECAA